jgi:hypothetical protein
MSPFNAQFLLVLLTIDATSKKLRKMKKKNTEIIELVLKAQIIYH